MEDGQLPPLIKLPNAQSLRQVLAVRKVQAPTREEVMDWYAEEPGVPQIPVQGNKLVVEDQGGAGERVKVNQGISPGRERLMSWQLRCPRRC